jgi:hypothetical protein
MTDLGTPERRQHDRMRSGWRCGNVIGLQITEPTIMHRMRREGILSTYQLDAGRDFEEAHKAAMIGAPRVHQFGYETNAGGRAEEDEEAQRRYSDACKAIRSRLHELVVHRCAIQHWHVRLVVMREHLGRIEAEGILREGLNDLVRHFSKKSACEVLRENATKSMALQVRPEFEN